ncbi:MsnO8 family LLM class oxidoreductase [Thiolapillus brandeum]|uniref:Luciferase family protein n=1 Tax=Thiolapillus brandeum TaxID=1076588 RepID=A0A7U6GHS7_9GAMM|nr:MsnO8 family LLM class oxidoreductase [Thiolapillus brandeum]BAO43871.1 luciferase family protein [Thiolapillus brandeum]
MYLKRISVLDQSPIHDGKGESSGLHDTLELARLCDQAGYHRYWCAEHHATPGYASPCPEMMAAHVACATERLRVGTGGVMLTHYSPFKVAEAFRVLNALHPGRIDLGIGRAPGGNEQAHAALAAPRQIIPHEHYPQQATELIGYLHGTLPVEHPFGTVPVEPADGGAPDVWMLGSSGGSSELAGQLGAGFALALFIGTHERSRAIVEAYRRAFRPVAGMAGPQALVAVAAIAADSREEAEYIAASHVYWKVQAFRHGRRDPLHPPKKALELRAKLSVSDQAYYDQTLSTYVLGTPDHCLEMIDSIAHDYGVEEVMVVNVTHGFAERKRSYQSLAEMMNQASR